MEFWRLCGSWQRQAAEENVQISRFLGFWKHVSNISMHWVTGNLGVFIFGQRIQELSGFGVPVLLEEGKP
jgi:hypothetical protein